MIPTLAQRLDVLALVTASDFCVLAELLRADGVQPAAIAQTLHEVIIVLAPALAAELLAQHRCT